jgi:TrbL/VirB6 plasmid conjugal transfer protein
MDSNTDLRLGAAGLLGLVLFGAVVAQQGPGVPEPIRIFPARRSGRSDRRRAYPLPEARPGSGRQSSLRRGMGREPRPVLLAVQRVQGARRMGGSGVIDQFLNVFTTYIDSGFGLLGCDVRFLSQTLIALDITLAVLLWALAGEEDVIARLIKKTPYIGFFAFLIGNFNRLAKVIFDIFSGLGLKAAGSSLSAADFLHPGVSRRWALTPASRSSTPPAN